MAIELGWGARAGTGRQLPALIRPCAPGPVRHGAARASLLTMRFHGGPPKRGAKHKATRSMRVDGWGPMGSRRAPLSDQSWERAGKPPRPEPGAAHSFGTAFSVSYPGSANERLHPFFLIPLASDWLLCSS